MADGDTIRAKEKNSPLKTAARIRESPSKAVNILENGEPKGAALVQNGRDVDSDSNKENRDGVSVNTDLTRVNGSEEEEDDLELETHADLMDDKVSALTCCI